jgi:hypothetical protein
MHIDMLTYNFEEFTTSTGSVVRIKLHYNPGSSTSSFGMSFNNDDGYGGSFLITIDTDIISKLIDLFDKTDSSHFVNRIIHYLLRSPFNSDIGSEYGFAFLEYSGENNTILYSAIHHKTFGFLWMDKRDVDTDDSGDLSLIANHYRIGDYHVNEVTLNDDFFSCGERRRALRNYIFNLSPVKVGEDKNHMVIRENDYEY